MRLNSISCPSSWRFVLPFSGMLDGTLLDLFTSHSMLNFTFVVIAFFPPPSLVTRHSDLIFMTEIFRRHSAEACQNVRLA